MQVILTQDFIRDTIKEIESEENLKRKRQSWNSERIRTGDLKPFVEARIKEMYPETHSMYSISDYSILSKVTNKKSKAYKEQPIRKITGKKVKGEDGAEIDTGSAPTEVYTEIVKRYGLNQAMQTLDVVFNENKYALLACFMDREMIGSQVKYFHKFFALAPYEFDVIRDKDGAVICVILSYPSTSVTGSGDGINSKIATLGNADEGNSPRVYAFWTETQHCVVEVKGKMNDENKSFTLVQVPGQAADLKNPYGCLPFVYVPFDRDMNYPNANPLASQTIEFNALMSVYLTSANMQIGILRIKRPEKQKFNITSHSLYTAIEVPQSSREEDSETDVDFISPDPDLNGHKEAVITYLQTILDEQGINGSQVINQGEKYSSGLDRLLAQADVQSLIEENQEIYSKVEESIYRIVSQQLRVIAGKDILPSDGFQIVYRKPKIMISDNEKLTNLKLMKDLGLWADHELVQMYDPNLSVDEAKQKLQEIQQAKIDQASTSMDPTKVFNGAQVTSVVDVAVKVGLGELTYDAGVNILITSFGIPEERAKLMIPQPGSVKAPAKPGFTPGVNPGQITKKPDEEVVE